MNTKIYDLKILVVDDLEDNLLLMEGILDLEGFNNVSYLSSAKEAIEYLASNKVDLIILDITMPEMDGITACRYIREELRLDEVMILLATAKDDIETLKIGLEEAGANDYVRKMYDNGVEFISRIKSLLLLKIQINITKEKELELAYKNKELQTLTNLLDKYVISSKTDKKGVITYASQAFINISGYSKEELIGKPHNIVRHPDMPKESFEDMWKVIKSGKTWRGEVKNLQKNGGYYWVDAIITADYDDFDNIIGYSAIRLDITAQKAAQFLASFDFLTSLPNRAKFEDIAEHAIKVSKRDKTKLAILFIDFDKFKHINDTLGHNIGDEMLKIVSNRLSNALREVDTIARIGGDEFVIMLESLHDIKNISKITTKLLDVAREPMNISGNNIHTSASIGISVYPDDGTSISELMKKADAAMYHAKDTGRDNYKFFTDKLNTDLMRRLEVEAAIKKAIKNESFDYVYQPKYNLNTYTCKSCEMLIRLTDDNLGTISPAEFIPIAEGNKMIVEIGDLVLNKACETLRKWKDIGLDIEIISVNISSYQLEQKDIVNHFINIVNKYNIDAKSIELELTEYSIIDNLDKNIEILTQLRELGFIISIDDFGTGYSSMSYLKRLPVDIIKIDKSFVDEISVHQDDFAITHAIIQLSTDLGYSVIAEGIECLEQENILTDIGCHMGQGFLYSKGLSYNDFIKFKM
jgi:diguanylate cyclase (GGDEF)-like protein/PAS domain S-box-containing protein